jgi:ubiquinone biosynthesis protein
LFKAYLDQVLMHGVFHADPHAGNMLLTPDARLALIDAGMVAHLASGMQDCLLRLLVALTEGNGTEVVEVLARTGEQLEDFDKQVLLRQVSALVAPVGEAGIGDLQVGRQLADLARASVESGLRPAPELTMLGKALLNLDDIARRLAPEYKPRDAIADHAMYLMRHRVMRASSPSNLVSAALEAKDLVEHLPRRVNRVLDSLAEGDFRMHIEGLNEAGLMRSVQKLANRCAAGLAVAAFVLAAAIFSVPAGGPKWMGVSAFTIVFLGLAFMLAAGLVMATLRHDLPQRKKARRT